MRGRPAEGLTIKAALLLGFGLTLGLWLWVGYAFTTRMAAVEREADAINTRYMQAQELLATVRPQVLLMSVTLRNALLDPDPGNLPDYRERVGRTRENVHDALERYVPVLHSDVERSRVERVRSEIDAFSAAILEVISGPPPRTTAQAQALLGRVVPRRELVIGVTDEVQALNRAAFIQQQAAIARTHRDAERRVWQQFGLSVGASLAIALLATFHVSRLESRLRKQREAEAQTTRDLQRLSAKLVQVQEEERRTIARELHDEVGQVLLAIKVELGLAEHRLEVAGAPTRLLEEAQSIADSALHTVRDLSHLLHPALLDDLGLAAAVDWYLRAFGRRHGVRVELRQDGMAERLEPDIEITAYRIVQEALTNVAKHAHATSCTVTLRHVHDTLLVSIEDDGIGFDPAAVEASGPRAGLGLLGVRERVAQHRGVVHIESAPGRGTRVKAELPVPVRPPAAPRDAPGGTPEILSG